MRHNKKINHLGRQSAHRKAMLANMASSLIVHKRINTTVAKAKALRMYVEPLVTKSKQDSTHSRRVVFSYLQDKNAVTELFRVVGPKVGDRPGGYTRILKTGFRLGDAADMCIIELVDFNETYSAEGTAAAKPKTRRSRSGAAKKPAAAKEVAASTETAATVTPEAVETADGAEAKTAAKPAAKKTAAKPKPATHPATPRTSGSKKVVGKIGVSKKG